MVQATETSPYGLHRVVEPAGVVPQQAWRVDPDPRLRPGETRIAVDHLNLDAASFRQLRQDHPDPFDRRRAVLETVATRGKMHNPVTGSGGMLLGTVDATTPDSPLELQPGTRIATLISLTLTPLQLHDELAGWDGHSAQIPCHGTAVLAARSLAAAVPTDLPEQLSLAVLDVCGAPALTARTVRRAAARLGRPPRVCVLGGAGKSGALSLAAAEHAGSGPRTAVVLTDSDAGRVRTGGLAERVVCADARDPLAVATGVGEAADVSVVCVDVPGCEHSAVLATADGGSIVFFSMATSFSAAALGAEGVAADVELLIGNGYTPGHAAYALQLQRTHPGVRALLEEGHRHTAQA